MLCAKYRWDDNVFLLHSMMDSTRRGSCVIQDIVKVLKEDSVLAKVFLEATRYSLGRGNSTLLWLDPWIDMTPLQVRFPQICTDKWLWYLCKWNLVVAYSFRRRLFYWELNVHNQFLELLNTLISSNAEDSILWLGDASENFRLKRFIRLRKRGSLLTMLGWFQTIFKK